MAHSLRNLRPATFVTSTASQAGSGSKFGRPKINEDTVFTGHNVWVVADGGEHDAVRASHLAAYSFGYGYDRARMFRPHATLSEIARLTVQGVDQDFRQAKAHNGLHQDAAATLVALCVDATSRDAMLVHVGDPYAFIAGPHRRLRGVFAPQTDAEGAPTNTIDGSDKTRSVWITGTRTESGPRAVQLLPFTLVAGQLILLTSNGFVDSLAGNRERAGQGGWTYREADLRHTQPEQIASVALKSVIAQDPDPLMHGRLLGDATVVGVFVKS